MYIGAVHTDPLSSVVDLGLGLALLLFLDPDPYLNLGPACIPAKCILDAQLIILFLRRCFYPLQKIKNLNL
jgi:hypothetical protein